MHSFRTAAILLVLFLCRHPVAAAERERAPNFIIILADDLGYGDLGCYGHPTIRTPQLDRMAREGQRWTQFYMGSAMCTPSRAALLTGRLPIRSGMCADKPQVLLPDSTGGLPASEITIAEALRTKGYATACIGKWHLGHLPQFLPRQNGFDYYFGLPYTNDGDRTETAPEMRAAFADPKVEYWHVPLMRNEEVIERPANQPTLTQRYADEAIRFIRREARRPFFLYLAYNMPHLPLFASDRFRGKSRRGLYGDVVEELDWNTGRILAALRELSLERRTLVVFTSDNGPWLVFEHLAGSAGLLRGGKGTTFEGGFRVPAIFWWPGTIKPSTVTSVGTVMDLFPTLLRLAGAAPPTDRLLDGVDLTFLLRGTASGERRTVFYYEGSELFAVRNGPYKAILMERHGQRREPPLLYNLERDPGERYDVAAQHGEILEEIRKIAGQHKAAVHPVPNQLLMRSPDKR